MATQVNNTHPGGTPTVAQLAVTHPGALSVFTKYNIDYCCGGHRSLEDACMRVGLDHEQIKKEIHNAPTTDLSLQFRPDKWTSAFLVDYIVQNHHSYVKEAMPEILQFLDKVCDAHGYDTPELPAIRDLFTELSKEMTDHMTKEEFVLFPALKRLEQNDRDDHPLKATVQFPIAAMEHEHDSAGKLIKEIRSLSNNYTPPEFACTTFRITYKKLQEFDNDLMRHIHLENNILFAKVKA